jgi:uncharacterized membrane protein YhaH (DUF805 family)
MFNKPFSFEGRIRRTEYGLSYIITIVLAYASVFAISIFANNNPGSDQICLGLYIGTMILFYWFLYAQGAKRCHDVGHSGWWQLIPFYFLWMLFQDGDMEENEYGETPKCANLTKERDKQESSDNQIGEQHFHSEPHYADSRSTVRYEESHRETVAFPGRHQQQVALTDSYGRNYPLSIGENSIGRMDNASYASIQIPTDDLTMSRNHAVIIVNNYNGQLVCTIQHIKNAPIYQNGYIVQPGCCATLNNGDVIRLGQTEFTFRE